MRRLRQDNCVTLFLDLHLSILIIIDIFDYLAYQRSQTQSVYHYKFIMEVILSKAVTSVWVLSDGTAGMRMQAVAVAAVMGWDQLPKYRDIIIKPNPLFQHIPQTGQWLSNFPVAKLPNGSLLEFKTSKDFPAILITCGRRMAGVSIALKKRAACLGILLLTVHLQDPRLDPALFDALIVPQHDPTRGPNVIVTKAALNRYTKTMILEEAKLLPKKLKTVRHPRVAVLLGGNNKRYKISTKMVENMIFKLNEFVSSTGANLLLVSSGRTPPLLLEDLQRLIKNTTCLFNDETKPNFYPGILGIVDAVIVTSDSVNMVSEAASTGKPVMVAPWTEETGRIAKFHEMMRAAGHTINLGNSIPETKFFPLDERALISAKLKTILSC